MGTFLAGTSAIALASVAVGTPFFMNWVAEKDVLFTHVKEGTAKAIMNGKSFNHFVMSLKGSHFNHKGDRWYDPTIPEWEVIKDPEGMVCDDRSLLTRSVGVYLVGIPPFRSVYNYHFEWNEMRQKGGKQEVWSRPDIEAGDSPDTDFIYVVSFPYIITLSEAETTDNMAVDVVYQLTIRVTNPFKALFDTENWMEVVTGIVNGAVRNFVGCKTFDELRSETDKKHDETAAAADSFTVDAVKLNHRLPGESKPSKSNKWTNGLSGQYGITIEKIDIQSIALAGAHKDKLAEATTRNYTATQEANAIRTLGQATADAKRAEGTAEADVITLKGRAEATSLAMRLHVLNKGGDLAKLLVQVDAMKADGPGKTIIWANNPLINQHHGLAEFLDKMGVAPDQLKSFIEKVMAEEKTGAAA